MIKYCLTTASILGVLTGVAMAQSTSTTSETVTIQPAPLVAPPPPPAPPANYSVTKTQRTVDANGVERDTTQSYEKTRSYSGGDGVLSSQTQVRTTGQTTTIVPPGPVTTTTTRTTTSETRE